MVRPLIWAAVLYAHLKHSFDHWTEFIPIVAIVFDISPNELVDACEKAF